MGASIARKRTRLGRRVLRHKLAQGCAFSCIMTCFSCTGWSFDTQSVLVHFLPNMCLRVASEVTLLEIPPCQTPMCGVAHSCSYVLLVKAKPKCRWDFASKNSIETRKINAAAFELVGLRPSAFACSVCRKRPAVPNFVRSCSKKPSSRLS